MAERAIVFDGSNLSYSAADHIKMWRSFLRVFTGVVQTTDTRDNAHNELEVVAGSGLQVQVREGLAFVDGYWYENTTPVTLTVANPHPSNARIDVVALELNILNETINARIIAGVPSATPVEPNLTNNTNIKQLKLARIDAVSYTHLTLPTKA